MQPRRSPRDLPWPPEQCHDRRDDARVRDDVRRVGEDGRLTGAVREEEPPSLLPDGEDERQGAQPCGPGARQATAPHQPTAARTASWTPTAAT